MTSSLPTLPKTVNALGSSTNVIANSSFENGVGSNGVPTNWDFETCEGTTNATAGVDPGQWTDQYSSAKVATGPLIPVGCYPGTPCSPTGCLGRPVGFSQFRQGFPALGYNFTQLTDSPLGFSFWFQFEPYNNNGMAAFEVRIFGAEGGAELDYVFNPDPSVGQFTNNTTTHALQFYGYQYGRWYHFSRNLKADWNATGWAAQSPSCSTCTGTGLSLHWNFTLVQFQGFASQYGATLKSETYWLDDVRVYVGPGQPPVDTHWANFNFIDATGSIVNSRVVWNLLNSTGQTVAYNLGDNTLADGPYTIQVLYKYAGPSQSFQIYDSNIHLDTWPNITLAMYPQSLVPGSYLALNNPVSLFQITQQDNNVLTVRLQGTTGLSYTMIADVPSKPALAQLNGHDLSQNTEWKYYTSLVTVTFTASSADTVSLYFEQPLRIPNLQFVDVTGYSIDSKISFRIIDPSGDPVQYSPGEVVPTGNYFLQAYYEGFQVYNALLAFTNASPIQVQMSPLDPSRTKYVAINSTATGVKVSENSDKQVTFSFSGTGPYLVVVDVPSRPIFVERNGVRTADWIYNATSNTVAIEALEAGSFNVVLQSTSDFPPIMLAVLAGAGLIITVTAVLLIRRKSGKDHTL